MIDMHADNFYRLMKPKDKSTNGQLTLASTRSCVPMLTTVHPIAFAELRQRVWFSFLSHGFSTFLVLMARSSIVPGTATFMSLLYRIITRVSRRYGLYSFSLINSLVLQIFIFYMVGDNKGASTIAEHHPLPTRRQHRLLDLRGDSPSRMDLLQESC